MFGNLKSKLGDVTDLKKLSSPQALASASSGSRQRSSQHTPGSLTPRSRHSRQASTASLQGLGLPISPPHSPSDQNGSLNNHDRIQELEREILKLRSTLETQQDAALERLNTKEQEWKVKLQEERDKKNHHQLSIIMGDLEAASEREKRLQEQLESNTANKKLTTTQLSEAQGLEKKVCELQDDFDQMEGLNTQEVAKIKHMLLNTNSELEESKAELKQKTETLMSTEARLNMVDSLEERIRALSEDKTSLEGQVTSLSHKFNALSARYTSLEEAKSEEVSHLQNRVITLEQRHSQTNLQETEKVQALIKERENMEHQLEEARQQLSNIKASWSEKITALENQIQNLNSKISEDQLDLQEAEKENHSLTSELSALKERNVMLEKEKSELEKKLLNEINQQKEDLETLQWQLTNTTTEKGEQITMLSEKLEEEEKLHKSAKESLLNLENKNSCMESELAVAKDTLATTKADMLVVQNENRTLQETLHQERAAVQNLEKSLSESLSKLETVTGEKLRLSQNLDEYVEKVAVLEETVMKAEEEKKVASLEISKLKEDLKEVQQECVDLREKLRSSEEDLVHKIEESQLVIDLRQCIKNYENELGEKRQALKIQGQRLADMKKTIQRELRLSADTVDSTVDSNLEIRPQAASPTLPAVYTSNSHSTGATASNGSDEDNGVNNTYLKHVIIKYLTSREYEAVHLTRAVATLLHMTPDEETLLRETLEWKMSWFGSKPNLGKGQKSLTIPPSN
ncbi:golgin subfamily A member 1-like isoform X2 [Penaeus japonicus]|uniref:golgin subfamily A member 1-like isoform X2 n=1 Tax=Penaeus japonicus TaxID=27405 RepID=UPI001C70EADA|nr:golgin subfamily A member 1-like isoform X2 [Penaeus japonicus]